VCGYRCVLLKWVKCSSPMCVCASTKIYLGSGDVDRSLLICLAAVQRYICCSSPRQHTGFHPNIAHEHCCLLHLRVSVPAFLCAAGVAAGAGAPQCCSANHPGLLAWPRGAQTQWLDAAPAGPLHQAL
jgi:hypothetical protein